MDRELPSDTDPEAERVQIELLRRASPGRRITLALSLTETVIALARGALRRAQPGLDDRETGLRFVALHYGEDLAERVRADLVRRGR
jgi:hypothetical protein